MGMRKTMLVLLLCGCLAGGGHAEDVVVNTPQGSLRGTRASFMGKTISTFLGVPYGESQRFQAPTPAGNWSGIRDANTFPPMCPQTRIEKNPLAESEDCLYLNVYAAEPSDSTTQLPVMVWIHGGSYMSGTASYYNGTALAAKGVVVVTINYRLDVLGFLSTGDDVSPGNFGLLDQQMALKWVKDTIASFHGNASDVTIFGESAGSASVSILRLSPLSKGLFSKAIMESGVSLSPWAVGQTSDVRSPLSWAKALALEVGCGIYIGSTTYLVDCLKRKSASALISASTAVYVSNGGDIIFRPVVEQIFGVVPKQPMEMLQAGYGNDVISLRGVNKDEYSLMYMAVPLEGFARPVVVETINKLGRKLFRKDPTGAAAAMLQEYYDQYNYTTLEQLRNGSVQLRTDLEFVAPTVLETRAVLKAGTNADQFLYHYTYRPANANWGQWAGVPHASEIPIVFGQPFENDSFVETRFDFQWTAADKNVSDDVMTLWTNFAKYGTPTPQPVGDVTWSPDTPGAERYLQISSALSGQAHLKAARMAFWTQLWDKRQ